MRASSFARIAACPGSWKREQALRGNGSVTGIPATEESTPEAESGTAIHNALANLPHRALTVDEELVFERCAESMQTYIEELGNFHEDHVEQTFNIPAEHLKLGDLEITGHPDRVVYYQHQKRAVLFDFKSGWADVPDSSLNLQMRCYAVAIKMRYGKGIDRVDVVILKPRVSRQPDCTIYYSVNAKGHNDFMLAFKEIQAIASRALDADPENDLHPSEDACKYCPARAECPAVNRQIDQIATLALQPDKWESYPIAERLGLWDKIHIAEKAIGLIKARYKQDLERNPEAYQGALYLKAGSGRREITDPSAAFAVMAQEGVLADAFASICNVPIGALEDLLRDTKRFQAWYDQLEGPIPDLTTLKQEFAKLTAAEIRKLPCVKGDALKKHFNALIDPLCERKPREPSVEVDKEKLQLLLTNGR